MKNIIILLIFISLSSYPFKPFSQNTLTSTPIASVEYLKQQPPPIEKGIKKKKHKRKLRKSKFKKKTKLQTDDKRKGIPTLFFILAAVLTVGLVIWMAYYITMITSGAVAASWGCLAPLGVLFVGVFGTLLSLIMLAGIILFIIFAILILNKRNGKYTSKSSKKTPSPETEDYISTQIKDKASKSYPALAPKTLEKYTNLKRQIVELKYDKSALEKKNVKDPRVAQKIDSINTKIHEKEIIISAIEKSHTDLEKIPQEKRAAYTDHKINIAKLEIELEKYQEREDGRAFEKMDQIKEKIQEQERELKLLLSY